MSADKPLALRLADELAVTVQTYPQTSEDEPGGYCRPEDRLMDDAAAELRRLAEVERERDAAIADLSEMTADRDSWQQQVSDRIDDALAAMQERDELRAQLKETQEMRHDATHEHGWLRDGALLYRLTDERRPQNRDEIRVTMADGSHSEASCARRAGELLDMIDAAMGGKEQA